MADEVDRAQTNYELFMEGLLAEHAHRRPTGESRTHCIDCQQPIPEDRREAAKGCTRCITCQEAIEIHTHWSAL